MSGEDGGASGGRPGPDAGGAVVLGLMVLIGSSTAAAAKLAVADLPLPLLPILRFGVAGLALLPWAGGLGPVVRVIRRDFWLVLAAAFFAVPVNQGFFLGGTRLAPTTHVGLIYASCPLVVLGLSLLLGHERLAPGRLVGIAASMAGAAAIALGGLGRPVAGHPGGSVVVGDLLLVGAVTSWGIYLTAGKRLVARNPSIPVLAATFLVGALMCVPPALATAPRWVGTLAAARPGAWGAIAYLAFVPSVLGLACQNAALRRFDASHVATVGNLAPVLTVLWGVLLLGESLAPSLLVGGALTIVGALVAGRGGASRRDDAADAPPAPASAPATAAAR